MKWKGLSSWQIKVCSQFSMEDDLNLHYLTNDCDFKQKHFEWVRSVHALTDLCWLTDWLAGSHWWSLWLLSLTEWPSWWWMDTMIRRHSKLNYKIANLFCCWERLHPNDYARRDGGHASSLCQWSSTIESKRTNPMISVTPRSPSLTQRKYSPTGMRSKSHANFELCTQLLLFFFVMIRFHFSLVPSEKGLLTWL